VAVLEKMSTLVDAAKYDTCLVCGSGFHKRAGPLGEWIYPTKLPDGRTVLMLRILQTNACSYDCTYCVNRAGRAFRRYRLAPEELAQGFWELASRGHVYGLFLSSGVVGADRTQEQLITTAEILRERYRFDGYIHLKIMPGASEGHIARAMELADRVSVNLEVPTADHMRVLSGRKAFASELLGPMRIIGRLLGGAKIRCKDHSTQFVVGAAGETDAQILRTVSTLTHEMRLARAYYSAFQPVPDTPLADRPGTPLRREQRLYQAEYLLRRYGFAFEEFVFDAHANLSLALDPKLVWAMHHPERFPVEVNTAPLETLLRIPGIGPTSARRLVRERRRARLTSVEHLRAVGALARRAAPFVLLNGKAQGYLHETVQLSLADGASGVQFDEVLVAMLQDAVMGRRRRGPGTRMPPASSGSGCASCGGCTACGSHTQTLLLPTTSVWAPTLN